MMLQCYLRTSSRICCGNPIEEYKQLIDDRGGEFKDLEGCSDSYMCICMIIVVYITLGKNIATIDFQRGIIRHNTCTILLESSRKSVRCEKCANFQRNLCVLDTRLDKRTSNRTNPSSSVPYHSLSKKELLERTKNLHNELFKMCKKQQHLKELIEDSVDVHGVTLGDDLHNDFKEVIKECEAQLEGETPSSFKWMFRQQQMEASWKTDSRGMRWHPLMIKWFIYLRHQSQGAYETLRQSKCVSLPSQCTLRNYTHHVKATNGFSAEVDMQLCQAANLKSSTAIDQYVILLLDEMHIKESLVHDKYTGDLIGFTDLGDINSHVLALEQSLTDSKSFPPLASTVMTFMVRGLFSHLRFPYAYFPCHKVTADLLYDPF